jgi:hypothetical protein
MLSSNVVLHYKNYHGYHVDVSSSRKVESVGRMVDVSSFVNIQHKVKRKCKAILVTGRVVHPTLSDNRLREDSEVVSLYSPERSTKQRYFFCFCY